MDKCQYISNKNLILNIPTSLQIIGIYKIEYYISDSIKFHWILSEGVNNFKSSPLFIRIQVYRQRIGEIREWKTRRTMVIGTRFKESW